MSNRKQPLAYGVSAGPMINALQNNAVRLTIMSKLHGKTSLYPFLHSHVIRVLPLRVRYVQVDCKQLSSEGRTLLLRCTQLSTEP
jgi:hypothetical protein